MSTQKETTQEETTRQLVVTKVAYILCGIEIGVVHEIILMQPITAVPKSPHNMLGITNVRGSVVPVADLKACLGFPPAQLTDETRIVLVGYRDGKIGFVVDSVAEVIALDTQAIAEESDAEAGDEGADEGELNVELLESSFELLAPQGEELAERFYTKLFETAPAVRPLFPDDEASLTKALLGALGALVSNLRAPEKLTEHLEALGKTHVDYGALEPHYDVIGEVLLATMAELADDAWTDEVARAWSDAFAAAKDLMLAGAERAELAA